MPTPVASDIEIRPPSWPRLHGAFAVAVALSYLAGRGIDALVGGPGVTEVTIRTMGGVLQLCGLAAVASGLRDLRRQFALDSSIVEQLGDYAAGARKVREHGRSLFQRLLGRERKVTRVATGSLAATLAAPTAVGRGKLTMRPERSLKDRVDALEEATHKAMRDVAELVNRVDKESRERVEGLAVEATARHHADTHLSTQIRSFAVGGLRVEMVGLWCLVLGVILGTSAVEIRALLSWLGLAVPLS